jgi:Cdc6-like AAA superfamily ATPase
MSLSFIDGVAVAQIINTESGDFKTVYVDKDQITEKKINELLDSGLSVDEVKSLITQKIREIETRGDEKVLFVPSKETERVFIAGRSGMGKSTIAKNYMIQYKEMYPDNEIFLISRHEEDSVYDSVINDLSHIVVNGQLLDYEIELKDLTNSLVIFDDVDNLQDAKVSKKVHQLVDDLISNGRKYGIYVLYLGHQLSNYSKTRNIINEANKVFFFPGTSTYHVREFLQKKVGLEKGPIKKIMDLKSRWVCLNIMMPYNVIHENGVFII